MTGWRQSGPLLAEYLSRPAKPMKPGHQAGGDHGDGGAAEMHQDVGAFDALADAGEEDQREGETDRCRRRRAATRQVGAVAMLSSGTPSTAQLVVISGR